MEDKDTMTFDGALDEIATGIKDGEFGDQSDFASSALEYDRRLIKELGIGSVSGTPAQIALLMTLIRDYSMSVEAISKMTESLIDDPLAKPLDGLHKA